MVNTQQQEVKKEADPAILESNLRRVGLYLVNNFRSTHAELASAYFRKRDKTDATNLYELKDEQLEAHLIDTIGYLNHRTPWVTSPDVSALEKPTVMRDRKIERDGQTHSRLATTQRDIDTIAQRTVMDAKRRRSKKIEQLVKKTPAEIYAATVKVSGHLSDLKNSGKGEPSLIATSDERHPYIKSVQDIIVGIVAQVRGLKYQGLKKDQLNRAAIVDVNNAFPNGLADVKALLNTPRVITTPEELNAISNPRLTPFEIYKGAKNIGISANISPDQPAPVSNDFPILERTTSLGYKASIRYLVRAMISDLRGVKYTKKPTDQLDANARDDVAAAFPNGHSDMKTLLKTSKKVKTPKALSAITKRRLELKAEKIAEIREREEIFRRNEEALSDFVLDFDEQGLDGLAILEYNIKPPEWILVQQGGLTLEFPRAVYNSSRHELAEYGFTEAPYLPKLNPDN